ncbi:spherulation-specific family 4 protein [Streptomyces qinzhouensis]|uniref:Phage tail protein n=1 Tax=Streptomyces qinzhouensis TaxID=2599401 RepID=A0A5B8JBY6_9ACTN|nr:spherulation-specific family 4 protein [Streptomyces qinzhouensis]QDY78906.1 phage tail protein [Streptomyces qinzhouensis]
MPHLTTGGGAARCTGRRGPEPGRGLAEFPGDGRGWEPRPGGGAANGPWGRLRIGVPGYAHPLLAPAEWAELTRPGTPLEWVVLTVANGPGDRPDPHCLAAAGKLVNAGVRVLGRVDLAGGARPFGELVADADRYAQWYRVGGFLLDRCPADRAGLAAVRRAAAALRTVAENAGVRAAASGCGRRGTGSPGAAGLPGGYVVLGHGGHPHPGYAELADQLITFSGAWADYRWSQVAEWTAGHPPERFAHFVHGVPRTHLEEAARIARWQGAGTVFFTDRPGGGPAGFGTTPPAAAGASRTADGVSGALGGHSAAFESLPGYWDEFVSRIGPGVSE